MPPSSQSVERSQSQRVSREATVSSYPLPRTRLAIVVVDVAESVRLMSDHEDGLIERWTRYVRDVHMNDLPTYGGRMVKSLGDGLLVVFERAADALSAVLAFQRRIAPYNADKEPGALMLVRIGAHWADVVVHELDVFGTGVNIAARLAAHANPGASVVSVELLNEANRTGGSKEFSSEMHALDLGHIHLKHVSMPVHAYELTAVNDLFGRSHSLPAAPSMVPRIAILPFVDVSSRGRELALGQTLSDDLRMHLARSPNWQVSSRLSATSAVLSSMDLPAIGQRLMVDVVLSGCVREVVGERVRIDFELSDVCTQSIVWAEVFVGDLRQLLRDDDGLAACIGRHMSRALLRREMNHAHVAALPNLPSYALLLQAISLMHAGSQTQHQRGMETLRYLLERHPRAPEVLAWMAQWHIMRVFQCTTSNAALEVVRAETCLSRAVDLDEKHALTQTLLGHVAAGVKRQPAVAERHLRNALEANSSEFLAWTFLSHVLAHTGRIDEGLLAIERARALSPLDPMAYLVDQFASMVYGEADRKVEALEMAKRSSMSRPDHLPGQIALIIATQEVGDEEAARSLTVEYLLQRPNASVARYLGSHPAGDRSGMAQREADALRAAGMPP